MLLPQGEDTRLPKVIKSNVDPDGSLVGIQNKKYKINEDSLLDFRGEINDSSCGTKISLLNVEVSATMLRLTVMMWLCPLTVLINLHGMRT